MLRKMQQTSVLVTGSSGFIGSHLCARLIADLGCKVIGIDSTPPRNGIGDADRSLNTANDRNKELFSFKEVDITNSHEVDNLYRNSDTDFVFHLAALANPRACKANFDLAFKVNVRGTKNIVQGSPKDSRLVFMSSAAVYGMPTRIPIGEEQPRNGTDPYAVTKIMGEDLCKCMLDNYEHDICIGRNFNAFGEGQIADYIIPTLIKQAVMEHTIQVWNSTPVRDFLYIEDTINALITIAERGKCGEKYNIGSGRGTRIGELVDIVKNIMNEDMDVQDLKKEVTGSNQLIADASSLKKLGWEPRIDLQEGIRRTVEYFKKTK